MSSHEHECRACGRPSEKPSNWPNASSQWRPNMNKSSESPEPYTQDDGNKNFKEAEALRRVRERHSVSSDDKRSRALYGLTEFAMSLPFRVRGVMPYTGIYSIAKGECWE